MTATVLNRRPRKPRRLKSAAIAIALAACLLPLSALPPTGQVMLAWDYPPHGAETSFNLYTSLSLTPTAWVLLTNTPAQQVTVQTTKHIQWFTVTAYSTTNWWHESDFSEPVSVPEAPLPGSNLTITLH